MKTAFWAWTSFLALLLSASGAMAESSTSSYRQVELEQILAPIALYPDPLLSQILIAATYPLEVVKAARWSRSSSGLRGDDAVRAVENQDWDPSVKSLVAFPEVLSLMDEKLEWTQRLGDAFSGQESDVMATVQALRARAQRAGNLHSSEQLVVQRQGTDIIIEPPTPELVYVPYYDPNVVYGQWWAPEYPPDYWWPTRNFYPIGYGGFGWSTGIVLASGFFFGACDWRHRRIRIGNDRAFYYHAWNHRHDGDGWRHDNDRRTAYGNQAIRQSRRGGAPHLDGYRANQTLTGTRSVTTNPTAAQAGFFQPQSPANPVMRSAVATPTPPRYNANVVHAGSSANYARYPSRGQANAIGRWQPSVPVARATGYATSPRGYSSSGTQSRTAAPSRSAGASGHSRSAGHR